MGLLNIYNSEPVGLSFTGSAPFFVFLEQDPSVESCRAELKPRTNTQKEMPRVSWKCPCSRPFSRILQCRAQTQNKHKEGAVAIGAEITLA